MSEELGTKLKFTCGSAHGGAGVPKGTYVPFALLGGELEELAAAR